MIGYNFSKFDPNANGKSPFETLLDLFMQLLTYTNGDFDEAMQWMNELDKEYKLTNDEYGMGDFIEDLKEKGYIDEKNENGEIKITSKTEQGIRKKSLEEIFGKLKKTKQGNHKLLNPAAVMRSILKQGPFSLVIRWSKLILPASIRNAQINHGIDSFQHAGR